MGSYALPAGPVTLRLLPPLVWEEARVDELLEALEALEAVLA